MKLPIAGQRIGLDLLRTLVQRRTLLAALEAMNHHLGTAFQITLPHFNPAVFIGPEASRQIMVTNCDHFSWRTESDPVCKLLRRGLLVVDGQEHEQLRALMDPPLYRRESLTHLEMMWRQTDRIMANWEDGAEADMLVEMRKVALLILVQSLFGVDFMPDMKRMWHSILGVINYISPGLWLLWPKLPRWGYRKAIRQMDDYLYGVIERRRLESESLHSPLSSPQDDLLGRLIAAGLDDDLIRDQMLTMLIAGHDTSTALLAWALFLLGSHPEIMAQVKAEVEAVLGDKPPQPRHLPHMPLLDAVIKETLRLYPPIHVSNRRAAEETTIQGYAIPPNLRVMASIYLTHRDEAIWEEPENFCPHRFTEESRGKRPPFTYLPFGGGPRNCIGAAFAQVEAKAVLARILQQFDLELLKKDVRLHMGATLEPRPGVFMRVYRRESNPQR